MSGIEEEIVLSDEKQQIADLRARCRSYEETIASLEAWPDEMDEQARREMSAWRGRCLLAEREAEKYRKLLVVLDGDMSDLKLELTEEKAKRELPATILIRQKLEEKIERRSERDPLIGQKLQTWEFYKALIWVMVGFVLHAIWLSVGFTKFLR